MNREDALGLEDKVERLEKLHEARAMLEDGG